MNAANATTTATPISVARVAWRAMQHARGRFLITVAGFGTFLLAPLLTGWFLGRGFHAIQLGQTGRAFAFAAAALGSEALRMVGLFVGGIHWNQTIIHIETLLRANMLRAQLASGGSRAGASVDSAGEAITHFRDDIDDLVQLIDAMIDTPIMTIYLLVSGAILASLNVGATAVMIFPFAVVALTTKVLDERIKDYRARDRQAAAAVTGFVGDVMSAATTVKVNHANERVLARLATLTEQRRRTAVRDRLLDEGIMTFGRGMVDVAFGLALLVAAPSISRGEFGAAQIAVFIGYIAWLGFFPRLVGRVIARHKQSTVAIGRMAQLVAAQQHSELVLPNRMPIDPGDARPRRAAQRPARVPLQVLAVDDLSATFPGGAGIRNVNLRIERGSFTIVTGPIGAGKTTLLRALLGLASNASVSGEVFWNGRPVADRAAFLVPPNAAYLSQVPQLISDSLADNIALGEATPEALQRALDLVELGHDVASMADGTSTMIGPRGLRLSGGQRQRVATARALIHAPELVVLDDLSSALDVETEVRLWDNLAAAGMTVLAVSHRAVAFDRASQVVRLDAGRVIDS